MNKKNIAVIFGGCSPEYSVSLESAHAVLTHIDLDKYNAIPVGITNAGDWYLYRGNIENIPGDKWFDTDCCSPAALSPNRGEHCLLVFKPGTVVKIHIDAAFPVMHGKNGEDGTVQGLLELAGIPLIGCGVLASALCMDKDRAHKLAELAGIAVPKSIVLEKSEDEAEALRRAEELGFPLFVKPVRAGSSYGITKVTERTELEEAVKLAFEFDERVIIEEGISGFEVGCAVMGNDKLTVGELDEIELSDGFFDFTEKYTLKTSAIHVPARISPEKTEEMKRAAKTIYKALDCKGFARVDMFLEDSGRVVFNEVNTIPGFTAHSRYPGMMKAAGLPFGELISRLIEQGVSA